MVKADLTRDYYGDLELSPTADLNEIKKQFKKLALTYHPDRNPGRESDVTAKFQKIQSAHEVLTDPQERAKYDANRVRPANRYQSGGNQKGNPWSNVSSQYPAPPKPPTARNRPPPPSAGAQRYKNFEAPRQTANQSAQEGPEARRSTYAAWEHMRNAQKTGPGEGSSKPGSMPKASPQPDREESNTFRHRQPPKAAPGYDEFRTSYSPGSSPHRRAQSTSAQHRKGFMPNTPGGDEPAAPRNAYFTQRNKSAQAPEAPPRNNPPQPPPTPVDPLRQFREKANMPYEPRLSTPYATHGGEKLNPFDSSNMNRSKSTREPRDRFNRSEDSQHIPRAGSDSNLNSPQRPQSYAQSSSQKASFAVPSLDSDDSISDAGPELKTKSRSQQNRPFAKTRASAQSPRQQSDSFSSTTHKDFTRVPDSSSGNKNHRSSSSGQASQRPNSENPSMYGNFHTQSFSPSRKVSFGRNTAFGVKLPTVSESLSNDSCPVNSRFDTRFSRETSNTKYPFLFPELPKLGVKLNLATPPSGVSSQGLFPLEEEQRSVLDKLIASKRRGSKSSPNVRSANADTSSGCSRQSSQRFNEHVTQAWSACANSAETGSPSKKQRPRSSEPHKSFGLGSSHRFRNPIRDKLNANHLDHRFNFKIDDTTFQRTNPNGFSSSAENINTKFTPEEWEGKFEAGYFQPEQKAANMPQNARSRAQSGSRSRGRSPVKTRTPGDSQYVQNPHSESDNQTESPRSTKFSQGDWAGTFKPQTFMPPPPPLPSGKIPPRNVRKPRGTNVKPTMGTAAVVDDSSDSSLEKPLFGGRQSFEAATPAQPAPPSPDAMDVDTPPVFKPATPDLQGPRVGLNISTSPPKRPAASSQTVSPTDQESLKVNFEDMKIQDIISSMDLPSPPRPPKELHEMNDHIRPTQAEYEVYLASMAKYMKKWDIFYRQVMLHFVARKNQNDGLADKRWMDDMGLETYRLGLREDKVVLNHFVNAEEDHSKVLKAHAIIRERMKEKDERERPRKKVS